MPRAGDACVRAWIGWWTADSMPFSNATTAPLNSCLPTGVVVSILVSLARFTLWL